MAERSILVVDDEPGIRFALNDYLGSAGFRVTEAGTCSEAIEACGHQLFDAAVLDFKLPDGTAIELIRTIKGLDRHLPIVVLTAHASIDLAVTAIKEGANQFLTKPVELAALASILERLVEHRQALRNQEAAQSGSGGRRADPFVGSSRLIRELRSKVSRLAGLDRSLLVSGETGSGKGVLAKWIHGTSNRADGPFVELNCAGLSRDLLESELFGHEKGAFTGAIATKRGMLEVAHNGTVFLDEIGEISLEIQPKLLKALEDMTFRRVGGLRDLKVDVRIIAATNRDLWTAVQEAQFRADLYYRISALPIEMPALRNRIQDLDDLVKILLTQLGVEIGRPGVTVSEVALKSLMNHSWPGNIRELKNVLERAVLLGSSDVIETTDLFFDGARQNDDGSSRMTLAEIERFHVERVLGEEDWHVLRAADRLGVPKTTLYRKIKSWGLSTSQNGKS